ncbi:MAG: hypothetical protein CMH83_05890 [Nocardioides sp.]|nr:hypothetical protein [Nocardioides sp.]
MTVPARPASVEARVLAALEGVDVEGGIEEFAESVCRQVAGLLPDVAWVSYNETSLVSKRTAAAAWPPDRVPDPTTITEVVAGSARQNPLVQRLAAEPDSPVVTWAELADERFWRSRLYRHVYAPRGVRHQAVFGLPGDPGVVTGVAANRCERPFDEEDVALLDRLRPHLVTLHRVVADRERARAIAGGRGQWEDVLLSDDGTVLDATVAAATLGEEVGMSLAVGASVRTAPTWQRLAARADRSIHRLAPVVVPHHERTVDLVALLRPAGPHLLRLRRRTTPAAGELGDLGLTVRQAEVAALVAAGADNVEIAADLCITVATVRKHLEVVYSRLGVTSRAGAVAEIARRTR